MRPWGGQETTLVWSLFAQGSPGMPPWLRNVAMRPIGRVLKGATDMRCQAVVWEPLSEIESDQRRRARGSTVSASSSWRREARRRGEVTLRTKPRTRTEMARTRRRIRFMTRFRGEQATECRHCLLHVPSDASGTAQQQACATGLSFRGDRGDRRRCVRPGRGRRARGRPCPCRAGRDGVRHRER